MKGKISTEGYRSTSPDRNNDFNVIPSNLISMSQVDFPILGVDNLGNKKMMQPNKQYKFKGSHVLEIPQKQMGGGIDGLSPEDARQALIDGHIMGKPLSDEQRTYFAQIAGTDEEGNLVDEEGNVVDESEENEEARFGGQNFKRSNREIQYNPFMQYGGNPWDELDNYEDYTDEAIFKKGDFFQVGGAKSAAPWSLNGVPQTGSYDDYMKLHPPVKTNYFDSQGQNITKKILSNPHLSNSGVADTQKNEAINIAKYNSVMGINPVNRPFETPPINNTQVQALPIQTPVGRVPMQKTGGSVMKDGGDFLRTLIKSAYKDVMKKGGQSSLQGMTGSDVLAERKNMFKDYLSNNAMYALAMEEHNNLMNPGQNFEQAGGNMYAQLGAEVAGNSEAYWNTLPGYSTQVNGTTGNSGMIGNPMPTNNYNPSFSQMSEDFQKTDSYRVRSGIQKPQDGSIMMAPEQQTPNNKLTSYVNPNQLAGSKPPIEQKQPNWFQKNGQGLANGIISGLNFGASFLDAQNTNANNKLLKQRTDADSVFQPNNYGNANRGDYDVNSGVYKPNQYTPVQNKGNMKFGGEQEEQYFSEAEIARLRKQGHKIIYLD